MTDKPNGVLLSWEQAKVAIHCINDRIDKCNRLMAKAKRDGAPVLMASFERDKDAAIALGRHIAEAFNAVHDESIRLMERE